MSPLERIAVIARLDWRPFDEHDEELFAGAGEDPHICEVEEEKRGAVYVRSFDRNRMVFVIEWFDFQAQPIGRLEIEETP